MSTPVPPILKECHRLRKHLRELQSEIDLGPRVTKIRQKKLADEEQAHKDAYDTIKKLKLKQKDDEGTLKQTEQRLAKLQTDIHSAASKKEFDAKTAEIAHATAIKNDTEDAILAAITEIEERTAALPAVEQRWADAQAEFKQAEAEGKERLERMLADQKVCQEALAAAEAKLPPDVKGQYDRLVKSYGADGLAGVVGRACQQCRTTIPEGTKATLVAGAFLCCPSCGRALYMAD
jgi:predicted  nucleic acid-binding Zn-ribbon protein